MVDRTDGLGQALVRRGDEQPYRRHEHGDDWLRIFRLRVELRRFKLPRIEYWDGVVPTRTRDAQDPLTDVGIRDAFSIGVVAFDDRPCREMGDQSIEEVRRLQ
jgi:hypothetical protein